MPDIPTTKTCTCCNTPKPLGDFYKDRTQRDGYRLRCKDCTKAAKSKTCNYCKERKKIRDFYSGSSRCKSCEAKRTKKRSKGSQLITDQDINELATCLSAVQTQINEMKVCSACSLDLKTDFFNLDSTMLDGYKPICQACEKLEAAGQLENLFIRKFARAQQLIHLHMYDILTDNQ